METKITLFLLSRDHHFSLVTGLLIHTSTRRRWRTFTRKLLRWFGRMHRLKLNDPKKKRESLFVAFSRAKKNTRFKNGAAKRSKSKMINQRLLQLSFCSARIFGEIQVVEGRVMIDDVVPIGDREARRGELWSKKKWPALSC